MAKYGQSMGNKIETLFFLLLSCKLVTMSVDIRQYIRPEFQEHFENFNMELLCDTLCMCDFNFIYEFLLQNPDKINWPKVSSNPAEWAKQMLLENPVRIHYAYLSYNSSDWAINLLKETPDKIYWSNLLKNPNIFCQEVVLW